MNKKKATFRKLGVATIIAIYFLILVGGIVRSTGSGMGCPDWPKCFGQWIPPTEINQLPQDYKEKYAEQRKQKNLKLAKYLNALGFVEVSEKLKSDKSIYVEDDFNALKTWIEYINRLIGVLIGFLVLGTALYSVSYLKTDKSIFFYAWLSVLIVIIQAWIGSVVVSTNLLGGIITIHMLLAILIVFLLTYVVLKSYKHTFPKLEYSNLKSIRLVLGLAIVFSLIQIVFGTQIREDVDIIAKSTDITRQTWIEQLDWKLYFHRSFSILILGINIYLFYNLKNKNINFKLIQYSIKGVLGVIFLEVVAGAVMFYFAIPSFLQPIHLFLGNLMIGLQFILWIALRQSPTSYE